MLLNLEDAHCGYGKGYVLHGVSFHIERGEMVSLIGPNGAGKSTILRTLSGLVRLRQGRRIFNGKDITSLSAHKIGRLGIAHVPEGRMIFGSLTVLQNLLLGAYTKYNRLGKAGRRKKMESIFAIFPVLSERREQMASTLSGGEQQMLAIGRALMMEPEVLLLDEPSLGLAPLLVEAISEVISGLRAQGITSVLAEQNAVMALELTDRAYLVEEGVISLENESKKMALDERVIAGYLGKGNSEGLEPL